MIAITEAEIDSALPRIEKGLTKYCWIQDHLYQGDVTRSDEFQRCYNGFYRVRRNAEWRAHYYQLMEKAKNREPSFPEVLASIHQHTGNIEASFSSKLIATVNPNKPVIDQYVLNHFRLSLPAQYKKNREAITIRIYDQLCEQYAAMMAAPLAQTICRKFANKYPWAMISKLKMVDLVLWQSRAVSLEGPTGTSKRGLIGGLISFLRRFTG